MVAKGTKEGTSCRTKVVTTIVFVCVDEAEVRLRIVQGHRIKSPLELLLRAFYMYMPSEQCVKLLPPKCFDW